jgi:YVTN family beta-propeller protein
MPTPRARPAFHRFLVLALAVGGLIGGTRVVVEAMDIDDAPGSSGQFPHAGLSPSHDPGSPMSPRAPAHRPGPANVYASTEHGMSPAVAGDPERVYVPNSESGSVDVIDPATFRVVSHFSVGSYPEHITPSWNLRWLYVDDTYGNALTVVDPRTGRPTGRIIPVTDPYNLYFTPDGSKAIVVAERDRRLDFRDPRSWRLIKSVPIPAAGPDHLDFSGGGRFLLVSAEFSGEVFRVSTTSMKVTGSLRVGGSPIDVRLSPDGSVFYVANQRLDGVSVIDARALRQVAFIPTGTGAHGLAVSRDARFLYVSNRLAGSISVVAFASRRVVATWQVGGSPDMMQVSPDGRELWVSNRFDGTVSAIDMRTGHVIHVIPVGSSPHGLAFFPQPGRYSLGHNGVFR